MQWQDRAHFFAVSAQLMRRILVDRARRRNLKRGAGIQHINLNEAALFKTIPDITVLDDALNELSRVDQRKVQIVEMRFFGGLSVEETAEVLPPPKNSNARLERGQGLAVSWTTRCPPMDPARWKRVDSLLKSAISRPPQERDAYIASECAGDEELDRAKAALDLSKGQDVMYGAAYALVISGESGAAQRLADDLNERFPEDTIVQFIYLPTLRAQIALRGSEPGKAIAELQVARPYDLALPGTAFFGLYGGLYPAYVRGEAYLAAHQGAEAAAELQKILDNRWIAFADPIGALAHLQLARALVSMGDKAKAKATYHDVLTLWKGADPEIPIVTQAKAEYARL